MRKVYSFPGAYLTDYGQNDTLKLSSADVFTVIYDNSLELKETMQNISDAYLFIRATGTDGIAYKTSLNVAASDDTDKTKMTFDAASKHFSYTFIPNVLFELPEGIGIAEMHVNIIKSNFINSNDAVDGTFSYVLRCD